MDEPAATFLFEIRESICVSGTSPCLPRLFPLQLAYNVVTVYSIAIQAALMAVSAMMNKFERQTFASK